MHPWVSLVVGLVGTLVGASGAVASQWHNANRQDRRAARQAQFDSTVQVLTGAYGFIAAADELQRVMDATLLHAQADTVYTRFLQRWDTYIDQLGPARLAAPARVVTAGRRLEEALFGLFGACDRWYVAFLAGESTSKHADRWDAALMDATERRREYVKAARLDFPEYGPGPLEDQLERQG